MSLMLTETLPTGKYDRLHGKPSDGLGAGAYTTTLSLYCQYYFWTWHGRILRSRLDVSYTFSDAVRIRDRSVYDTNVGFRGYAIPGDSFTADSGWELSVTSNWVLALDLIYQHGSNTRVVGSYSGKRMGSIIVPGVETELGPSEIRSVAPALEYNWSDRLGLIVGVQIIPAVRNVSAAIVPMVALNFVH